MIRIEKTKINKEYAIKLLSNKEKILYDGQPINFVKIAEFSAKMKNGKWKEFDNFEESVISLSITGKLMNGLHRLMAVVESDCEIIENVAFDVPEFEYLPEKDLDGNYDEFTIGCSEFILDYLNIMTRSYSTVQKIHNSIFENLKKIKTNNQENNRFEYAKNVAAIYALKFGICENEIKEKIKNNDKIKTIPNEHFEFFAKIFLSINENEMFFTDLTCLLPESLYKVD